MFDMSDRCEMWLSEQEKKLSHFPKCDQCGEHIQDEYRYRIDGYLLCESCFDEYVKVNFLERNEPDED